MLLNFSPALSSPPHKPPRTVLRRQTPHLRSNLSAPNSEFHHRNNLSLNHRDEFVNFPPFSTTSRSVKPLTIVRSSLLSSPIISPNDSWGTWTALFASAAFGLWSEKTKIGSALSGPLVATLVGLAASNVGIIASEAKAYSIVMEFLLPLAVPLLLFRADIRRVIKSTGKLLLAFLVGSVATIVGTLVAFFLVPMRSLGGDAWKIAAALMGRHIGGAVNYVAIAEALEISPSVLTAGLAADNVLCAVYFTTLFALASRVPPETEGSTGDGMMDVESNASDELPVLQSATAIAVSFLICKAGSSLTQYFGVRGGMLPAVTAIVVLLATLFPKPFYQLAPSGEVMAMILMQVFFTVVGASGNVWSVINTAPSIFLFCLVQISVHLALILGLGKLFGFDLKLLLIASNANVGGPTTACGMATAKGWRSMVVPGILAGIFGISIATFLGYAIGTTVLQFM